MGVHFKVITAVFGKFIVGKKSSPDAPCNLKEILQEAHRIDFIADDSFDMVCGLVP
jgi:hypothetical protein